MATKKPPAGRITNRMLLRHMQHAFGVVHMDIAVMQGGMKEVQGEMVGVKANMGFITEEIRALRRNVQGMERRLSTQIAISMNASTIGKSARFRRSRRRWGFGRHT